MSRLLYTCPRVRTLSVFSLLSCDPSSGEVKYCVAKLFSNDVKFAKITDY